MCGCAEESVNHVLIHCIMARALWELVLGLVGVKWVFPESVKEVLFSWRGHFVGKKGKRFGRPYRYVYFGWFGKRGID